LEGEVETGVGAWLDSQVEVVFVVDMGREKARYAVGKGHGDWRGESARRYMYRQLKVRSKKARGSTAAKLVGPQQSLRIRE
jgi:hypothetical protein